MGSAATSYTIVTTYKPLSYILVYPLNLKVDAAVDSIVTGYVNTLGRILSNLYTVTAELGISKRAKLSRLSLLACNFWHLELACLACLAKTVGLLGLLARLINFYIEVLGLYTKSRLWPTPRSLLCDPTRAVT
jgi:hypothetical protein